MGKSEGSFCFFRLYFAFGSSLALLPVCSTVLSWAKVNAVTMAMPGFLSVALLFFFSAELIAYFR